MRWSRQAVVERPGLVGTARVARSASKLLPRLEPGDVAVLDHVDLDGATAQALVDRRVAAVVNASPSTSGRYPNLGPSVLVEAGVPLLDAVGDEVFAAVRDGRPVRLEGERLLVDDLLVVSGVLQDADSVAAAQAQARSGLAAQLADLTANATGFVLDERDLLLEGAGIPETRTPLADRTVLVVTGSFGAADELAQLRRFVRRTRPVLVGVEGGADLLLARGLVPDVVVGDAALLSDEALLAAGERVVRPGGEERLESLALTAQAFATTAGSEDMALLLATAAGASLVVTAGFPRTLHELLDRGRAGASSSLPVRAGLGERVVPARVAAALTPRPRRLRAVLRGLVGLAAVAGAAWAGAHGDDLGWLPDTAAALRDRLPL